MKKIPASLLSIATLLLHVLAIPIFFLSFILIYQSRWMTQFLSMNGSEDMLILNTLILTVILIAILCGSRIPITVMRNRIHMTWWKYTLWSLAELLVFACFAALYMALMYGTYGYFPALGQCLRLTFSILPYGFVIIPLLFAHIRPDEPEAKEEDLIRFIDSTGRLKLVVAHDVLLYVEAQENYIKIHYLENEQAKEYTLRQSMKGIEPLMEKHGIIRCQRSYFVNPRHVTILRRDKEGFIQAELDVPNAKSVPVSPKYYEFLSKIL